MCFLLGTTDVLSVRLRSQPTAAVSVMVSAANADSVAVEALLLPLPFGPADWNRSKTVLVRGTYNGSSCGSRSDCPLNGAWALTNICIFFFTPVPR